MEKIESNKSDFNEALEHNLEGKKIGSHINQFFGGIKLQRNRESINVFTVDQATGNFHAIHHHEDYLVLLIYHC